MKFPNPASRYAMVGVFVAKFPEGSELSPALVKMVFFVLAILKRLLTRISTLKRLSMVQSPMIWRATFTSAEYRHLIGEMTRRAVVACE